MGRGMFDQLFSEIRSIRLRLEDIEKSISNWKPEPIQVADSNLLALPDHLRRTYLVVASSGECSAVEVSGHTGRCRANESNYLNQLFHAGWLNKRRVSKTAVFWVSSTPQKLEKLVK